MKINANNFQFNIDVRNSTNSICCKNFVLSTFPTSFQFLFVDCVNKFFLQIQFFPRSLRNMRQAIFNWLKILFFFFFFVFCKNMYDYMNYYIFVYIPFIRYEHSFVRSFVRPTRRIERANRTTKRPTDRPKICNFKSPSAQWALLFLLLLLLLFIVILLSTIKL